MTKGQHFIKIANGNIKRAQTPIIISASRATDIPAFYSDWLIDRFKKGYVKWKNPFNGVPIYISLEHVRLIVFWSKNPRPLIQHLDYFNDRNINYYFQYTLNDYEHDNLELNVPKLNIRIDTFKELSDKIGKSKIIWRFDPLIMTNKIGVDELLRKTELIGNQLKGYTDKMVFSYADIRVYKKVQYNLQNNNIKYVEFDENTMKEYAAGLRNLNRNWGFEIGTCSEKIALEEFGIVHNKCIDDDLMIRLFQHDKILMDYLGVRISPADIFHSEYKIEKLKKNKDKGQREFCGCVTSKDIGEYNTCPHLCEYCYANASKDLAIANWKKHKINPNSEMIKGE